MLIEITYNVTDVFMSTTETPVYVEISFEQPGGSAAVWGSITGTLSNQTDLQNALNAKLDESTIDGGTEGQILSKASGTDFDFAWINNYAKYLATNVRNQTGSTIGAFQVVYISGATGNKPLISLADADTEATSSKTYGVTATAIANNGTGDVVTAGELTGIDTSAFNEGDLLWLSTTAGGVVTSPPAEPAHAVFIGYVVRSHPTLGVIDVSIQNGYELNELHGVQITTPTDNQGLFYNATSTLWENKSITTALGYTPVPTTRNITINGVTYDLSADRTWTIAAGISGSGAAGQVTYWTGASAVSGSNNLFWDNANGNLGIGTNSVNATWKLGVNGNVQLVGVLSFGLLTANNSTGYIQVTGSAMDIYAHTSRILTFSANAAERARFHTNGNFSIGTISDLGTRLGVVGDTLLRGSGATSATTALTVQNSSSTNLFTVRNDGLTTIESVSTLARLSFSSVGNSVISKDTFGTNGLQLTGPNDASHSLTITSANLTSYLVGALSSLRFSGNFTATGGSTPFSYILINGTINQTNISTSIIRGLYVNPTLTAAADFRAIETSAGNVLFGSNFFWDNANGRLGIGTNAPSATLTVAGGITLSSGSLSLPLAIHSVFGGAYRFWLRGTNRWTFEALNANIGFEFKHIMTSGNAFHVVNSTDVSQFLVTGAGNTILGSTTDGGQRLQVVGDTLLRGSGATSATTALTVQNSSSVDILRVRNDGRAMIGSGTFSSNAGLTIQVANTFVDYASYLTSGSFYTYQSFGGWHAYGSDVPNGNILAIGGFRAGQWIGVSLHANNAEVMRIKQNGQVRFVPLASAPASPQAGDVYYDSTLNKLRVYTTAWETITSI